MSGLVGRRVVVTRAAEQAGPLVALLEAEGAVPVVVPLIAVQPQPEELDRLAALDPAAFDWLAVTSPNGAAHYVAAHGSTTPEQVAAVGTATAAVLRGAGAPVTLVPEEQRAAGLLVVFPRGDGSVLLVQAATAEPTLVDGLRTAGWSVTVVAPYRAVPVPPGSRMLLEALSADAVLFASGSAVRAWVEVFGTSTPPVVVAIGPQTAAAAEQVGLKVSAVATDHSLPGLVGAVERLLTGSE